MNSGKANKWLGAMKDELKSMGLNKVFGSFLIVKLVRELITSGSLRLNMTLKVTQNSTKPKLLPRVLLIKMVSTIRNPFHQFLRMIHSKLS